MAVVLFTLPLIGDVTLATALSVVGTVAGFLLRPHAQTPTFKSMTSVWGNTWPIVYNNFRIAGQVIQASNVKKHNPKFGKKGPASYSQTFAIGICEGPKSLGRIWADQQVIYDPRPIAPPPTWQAGTVYGAGDTVQATSGHSGFQFTATNNGVSGLTEPSWTAAVDASTRDGGVVWLCSKYVARTKTGAQFNFTMRVYTGSETQLPDSALEELVGAGNQTGYRGLFYLVFEDFDLSKFGNRIPNLEVEVLPGAGGSPGFVGF